MVRRRGGRRRAEAPKHRSTEVPKYRSTEVPKHRSILRPVARRLASGWRRPWKPGLQSKALGVFEGL